MSALSPCQEINLSAVDLRRLVRVLASKLPNHPSIVASAFEYDIQDEDAQTINHRLCATVTGGDRENNAIIDSLNANIRGAFNDYLKNGEEFDAKNHPVLLFSTKISDHHYVAILFAANIEAEITDTEELNAAAELNSGVKTLFARLTKDNKSKARLYAYGTLSGRNTYTNIDGSGGQFKRLT